MRSEGRLAAGLVLAALLLCAGRAGAGEYQMQPGYQKMQKQQTPPAKGGVEKEKQGFKIYSPEERQGPQESWGKTFSDLFTWLLQRQLAWFFLALVLASCVLMGLFRNFFSKYIPKKRFKATVLIGAGAFIVSAFGLAVVGLGIAVLLGRAVPEFPIGTGREAFITIGAGLVIFVSGFLIGAGRRGAALVVLLVLVGDAGRILWLSRGRTGEALTSNYRLIVLGVMAAGVVVLMALLNRRWNAILRGQTTI